MYYSRMVVSVPRVLQGSLKNCLEQSAKHFFIIISLNLIAVKKIHAPMLN